MKAIIISIVCLLLNCSYAVANTISGNISPTPGSVETYAVSWEYWSSEIENFSEVYWEVSNGVVLYSDKHSVTIQWNQIVWINEEGAITVYETLTGANGFLSVFLYNPVEGVSENCNGVLGPPAIFENFGTGPNPGPPYPNCTYNYQTACGIFPGEYTRVNSTVGCRSAWLGLPVDHTPGDVNGYMLMIDGDDKRGIVFSATVSSGLTSAFKYEFSAYLANLTTIGERPKVKFEIWSNAGIKIAESGEFKIFFDANDPWKRISMMVDIPFGTTSLTILLANQNNDEHGNDFVVDDLSFAPCFSPIIASFSNTEYISKSYTCNNGTVNLFASWPPNSIIPFSNPRFKWQRSTDQGVTWIDIQNAITMTHIQTENIAGIYQYRIYAYENSNPSLYILSNTLNYFVQRMVVDTKIYDVYNCNPNAVQLNPSWYIQYTDIGATQYYSNTYNWTPSTYLSSSSVLSPTISLPALTPPNINSPSPPPPNTYNYTLTIQNTIYPGCIASNTQTVLHYNPRKVVVPTAFTPDGDGVNDLFRPLNLQDYPGGRFWVYNRWGNLVFYSQGPTLLNYSWDGKYSNGQPADPGNYSWVVDIPGCANNIWNGAGGSQINNPFGNVLLIR